MKDPVLAIVLLIQSDLLQEALYNLGSRS